MPPLPPSKVSFDKLPGSALPVFHVDDGTKAAWVLEDTGEVLPCLGWDGSP